MNLTIKCPESDMETYLEIIKVKISEGYASGHDSQDKYWKAEETNG